MTERLVREIEERRKRMHDIERTLKELRTQISTVTGHMRTLQAAEREAADGCQKLLGQMRSKRRLRIQHLERRETMAKALSQGGGHGGVDLVAAHAAAIKAKQEALLLMAGQQHAIRWSLDGVKDAEQKVHADPGALGLAAKAKVGGGAAGRKSSDGGQQPWSLTGKLPDEISTLRDGPFARYMQRVYSRSGVSDGLLVLRRLHHWIRTESAVRNQSALAQTRHDRLLAEQATVQAELSALLGTRFVEPTPGTSAAPSSSEASSVPVPPPVTLGSGQIDELQEATRTAVSRAIDAEHRVDGRVSLILDAYAALGNLSDNLLRSVPEMAKGDHDGGHDGSAVRGAPDEDVEEAEGEDPEQQHEDESRGAEGEAERAAVAAAGDMGTAEPLGNLATELPARIRMCETTLMRMAAHVATGSEVKDAEAAPRRPHLGVRLGLPAAAERGGAVAAAATPEPTFLTSGQGAVGSVLNIRVAEEEEEAPALGDLEEMTADEPCTNSNSRRRQTSVPALGNDRSGGSPSALRRRPERKAAPPPAPTVLDREARKVESQRIFAIREKERLAALAEMKTRGGARR